ncbi:MAG: 50S ribosomal protein L23 [Ardenticatenia bacterium]|jgi:large subunit ribosomal protein L23|nr:MAG: 50S ribosomal protein L23 [Ardenticatenia bacterium]
MAELSPYEVIKRPLNTEKSTLAAEVNRYIFEVDRRANKVQIREAIEQVFKVEVEKVRVINMPPRFGRWGRKRVKRTPAWKKAIVTVAPGQKIEIFEGV